MRTYSDYEIKSADGGDQDAVSPVIREGLQAVAGAVEDFKAKHSDELKAAQDRIERLETAMKRTGAPLLEVKDRANLPIEEKAFGGFLRRGPERLADIELKSLSASNDQAGGYLVSSQFEREIIRNLVEMTPMRSAARVGSMRSSEIIIPRRTGAPTGGWVGETETRSSTDPTYGQVAITAHEMAAYVDVSVKLLEDAEFDVESEVAFDLAEEFARLEGVATVTGDGVKKPFGILNSASGISEVVSGGASSITADALISILYDLPAYYRGRASWMMNGTTLAVVRKLKDGQNQYLWAPGLAPGQPETLLGRPVIEAVDMPDIASNAYPIAVGDFNSGYRIYDRTGTSVLRDPFTLATTGQVRFHARRRVGGDVVKAEALRKMKVST